MLNDRKGTRYEVIKQVFTEALAHPAEVRAQYVATALSDPAERSAVEHLLNSFVTDYLSVPIAAALDDSPIDAGKDAHASAKVPGDLVGQYEIIRELGRGGMGTVYLVRRADRLHERLMALKIVHTGVSGTDLLRQFEREIRILASLRHPNIVSLIDAGTVNEGAIYFVMDYVEGRPLDEYCRDEKPTQTERLVLFRRICGAVAYAHRHLVVHRDLKPSNILIENDGTPKLVDFGVAKLLNDSPDVSVTTTARWRITLRYASPEQLDPDSSANTTIDVYSLSVLLYELLTAQSPYGTITEVPALLEAILHRDPVPPNAVSGRVPRELEAILMKGLRKDPAGRYQSVDALGEDVQRYLNGEPVLATGGAAWYRTKKLILRHRVVAGASAVLAIVLILSFILIWLEQRRAQRRFQEVRALSVSVLDDIKEITWSLPGAEEANHLIRQKAVEYRESLARETPLDWPLKRALLAAYFELGAQEGDREDMNLGKSATAHATFTKAFALAGILAQNNPDNPADQLGLSHSLNYLAKAEIETGKPANAETHFRRALELNRSVAGADAVASDRRTIFALTQSLLSRLLAERGDPSAAEMSAQAVRFREQNLAEPPGWGRLKRALAMALRSHGYVLDTLGRSAEAVPYYRRSIAVEESLITDAKRPTIVTNFQLGLTREGLGRALLRTGDTAGAQRELERALQHDRQIAKDNVASVAPKRMVASALDGLARVAVQNGDRALAAASVTEAVKLCGQVAAIDTANVRVKAELARYQDLLNTVTRPN